MRSLPIWNWGVYCIYRRKKAATSLARRSRHPITQLTMKQAADEARLTDELAGMMREGAGQDWQHCTQGTFLMTYMKGSKTLGAGSRFVNF